MQKVIKIGLLGSGTVGSGVIKVLAMNCQQITERIGAQLQLKTILVRDLKKKRPFLDGYSDHHIPQHPLWDNPNR